MMTLKIKYECDEVQKPLVSYRRQYSSCLRFAYNRFLEGKSEKEVRNLCKSLNHIDALGSWLISSAIKESKQIQETNLNKKVIFGSRKNFLKRVKGIISYEEFQKNRLSKSYSIGEKLQKGNRIFKMKDFDTIVFQPSKTEHYTLKLKQIFRRKDILNQIYQLSNNKKISLTYSLDDRFIYITFDESQLSHFNSYKIKNRVMGIDLNPNYIGWSIVDWKSESEYNIIKSGVYIIKDLNDKEKELKKLKLSSEDPKRIFISNKRNFEMVEISKNLMNIALYYHCELISLEKLDIRPKDNNKGKKYNIVVNNQWIRNKFINNLKKRCVLNSVNFLEVAPEYSSFIGNFLFRSEKLPDMILASIELGRRGYEYYNQYITKFKDPKKNIIQPEIISFLSLYSKSLEEFGLQNQFGTDFIKLYYIITKDSKQKYRVSLDSFLNESRVLRFSSTKSFIKTINF